MKRLLIIASLALAGSAHAMDPSLAQLLFNLREEYPALVHRTMPASEVRALCEDVSATAASTYLMRVKGGTTREQARERERVALLDGASAQTTRTRGYAINYAYALPANLERADVRRDLKVSCLLQLEP